MQIRNSTDEWQDLSLEGAELGLEQLGAAATQLRARDQLGNLSVIDLEWSEAAP